MQNKEERELYASYEDALFRLAVHKAAEQEGKRFAEEAKQMEDNPVFHPSKESEEKFIKLLDAELKKRKKPKNRLYLKRAAIILAAVIALFSLSLITVDAFRIQVFNFVLGINEKFTSFQLQENGGDQNSGKMIVDWKNSYVPTYMPDGYVADNIFDSESKKSITFKNKTDDSLDIVYAEYDASTNLELDTENANLVKTIMIDGNKGTLIIKNHLVNLVWTIDNKMFNIIGQVDENLIIKIAENVKYVN